MNQDIYISKTEKIPWIEFDLSQDLFDVDYILALYPDFWKALEVSCIAECCGLMAFSFYAEDISNASNEIDTKFFEADLIKLQQDLIASEKRLICSSDLNAIMHKTVFIQLIDHIVSHLS